MIIEKKARREANYRGEYYRFPSARKALEHLIRTFGPDRKKILLPAYVGFSTREGSGIYDPVVQTGVPHAFYRIHADLNLDLASLETLMQGNPQAMLLLVHYFGFEDGRCAEVRSLAARHRMLLIEDYAHGLFTYFQKPACPESHAIFSLHKMLPYGSGGVLRSPHALKGLERGLEFFEYDLAGIARKRCDNYGHLLGLLRRIPNPFFTILRPEVGDNVPQTLPLLVSSEALRDRLYFGLNEAGFGVVSLYHELIAPIGEAFESEKYLSRHILNLPVHQDAEPDPLSGMVEAMVRLARDSSQAL